MYACLYRPPAPDAHDKKNRGAREERRENIFSADSAISAVPSLLAVAREFSPRFEPHGDDLVSIDVSGLTRLLGQARTIGEELRREAAARGVRAHVAIAGTRMTALLIALARPGLTVIAPGEEPAALAPLPLALLEKLQKYEVRSSKYEDAAEAARTSDFVLRTSLKWGLKTLGDLASLPTADLVSRLGRPAMLWQAMARGEDRRPLVPLLDEERFESSLDLEWPIEDLEPLSFVLTRLLEPLATRLERRDRGAAVLHVLLRLVDPREIYARRLELPTPMRDVRTLRTLALLDLESHPPAAAIDRVTIVIDPTPGRVLQHRLFTRAQPTPEQISTLLARLGAVMGQDRVGAPATVDSYRPGAFAMAPFATDGWNRGERGARSENMASAVHPPDDIVSALRRCRQPVPARVAVVDGRPVRVTTDRRGFSGGAVTHCAGPWRTSGEWWAELQTSDFTLQTSGAVGAGPWDRDEWDVSLGDGAVYRMFQDRARAAWFIDAIVD